MLLGERPMAAGGGAWSNPYVTDGLFMMWDAAWNAGWNKHDSSFRMVELCGNGSQITLDPACVIGDDAVRFTTTTAASGLEGWGGLTDEMADFPAIGSPVTFEVVWASQYGSSWSDYFRALSCRDCLAFTNNHLRFFASGAYVNSNNRLSITPNSGPSYTTARCSCSSRPVAWNEWYCYYDGTKYTSSGYITNSISDTRLRILGSSVIGAWTEVSSIRIYSRRLSEAEILANQAADRTRFNITA